MTRTAFRFVALSGTILLAACGGSQRPVGFQATLPPPPVAAGPSNGAIFQAANGYAPMHAGARASRVGDLVTVMLMERTTTSKSASSRTQRDGGFEVSPPVSGPLSFNPGDLNSAASSSFNGQGNATQSNTLRGDITVTIAEIRPNGTALIRGEKVMELSQGDEWIQLTGIIRLADIDPWNRIDSLRIADAHVSYAGAGAVQRSSRQGWLLDFFNIISPF